MNSTISVSTLRKIGDTFIHVTVSASNYSPDGVTLKASEQAAAIEQFVAGLPGEIVSDSYGGPSNQIAGLVMPVSTAPHDIADPAPSPIGALGDLVDCAPAVENHVTEERPAIAAV